MKKIKIAFLFPFVMFFCSYIFPYVNYFEQGKKFYFQKEFTLAKLSFEYAIQEGITNEELLLYLGNSCVSVKDFTNAIKYLKEGLKYSSLRKFVFLYNLGCIYYMLKDYNNSYDHFRLSYESNPSFSKAHWLAGMASLRKKDINTTIKEWETYITMEPNGEESENIKKALKYLKEKPEEVLKLLEEMEKKLQLQAQPKPEEKKEEEIIDISKILESLPEEVQPKVREKPLKEEKSLEEVEK